jgi:hypothetical protein
MADYLNRVLGRSATGSGARFGPTAGAPMQLRPAVRPRWSTTGPADDPAALAAPVDRGGAADSGLPLESPVRTGDSLGVVPGGDSLRPGPQPPDWRSPAPPAGLFPVPSVPAMGPSESTSKGPLDPGSLGTAPPAENPSLPASPPTAIPSAFPDRAVSPAGYGAAATRAQPVPPTPGPDPRPTLPSIDPEHAAADLPPVPVVLPAPQPLLAAPPRQPESAPRHLLAPPQPTPRTSQAAPARQVVIGRITVVVEAPVQREGPAPRRPAPRPVRPAVAAPAPLSRFGLGQV